MGAFIPLGGSVCGAAYVHVVWSPTDYPKVRENRQVWATQPVVSTKGNTWRSPRGAQGTSVGLRLGGSRLGTPRACELLSGSWFPWSLAFWWWLASKKESTRESTFLHVLIFVLVKMQLPALLCSCYRGFCVPIKTEENLDRRRPRGDL